MKVGIMQPYFLPYIGYWQLMNVVDQYVIYDDVNFIKRGWINRNRILINGQPHYFNLPILGASQNKLIYEIEVNQDSKILSKNMRTIKNAYQHAPFFREIYELMNEILYFDETCISRFLGNSFKIINEYLNIKTKLIYSSELNKNCNLKGEEKIIAICKELNANTYYNAIGGQKLYSYSRFNEEKITLGFLEPKNIRYCQFKNEFQSNLSILDVLMFNSKEKVQGYLYQYKLLLEN